jgi:hypothetical protein
VFVIVEVLAMGACSCDRGSSSRGPETDTRRVRLSSAVETLGGGVSDGELTTLEDNLYLLAPSVSAIEVGEVFAVLSDRFETADDIAEDEWSGTLVSNTH